MVYNPYTLDEQNEMIAALMAEHGIEDPQVEYARLWVPGRPGYGYGAGSGREEPPRQDLGMTEMSGRGLSGGVGGGGYGGRETPPRRDSRDPGPGRSDYGGRGEDCPPRSRDPRFQEQLEYDPRGGHPRSDSLFQESSEFDPRYSPREERPRRDPRFEERSEYGRGESEFQGGSEYDPIEELPQSRSDAKRPGPSFGGGVSTQSPHERRESVTPRRGSYHRRRPEELPRARTPGLCSGPGPGRADRSAGLRPGFPPLRIPGRRGMDIFGRDPRDGREERGREGGMDSEYGGLEDDFETVEAERNGVRFRSERTHIRFRG